MKLCPQCRREYTDETLNFCLEDGSHLFDNPDESATAFLPPSELPSEARTEIVREAPESASGKHSNRGFRISILAGAIGLIILGGASAALYRSGWLVTDGHPVPFTDIKIERLTSHGKATQAVISPDGKQVVYVLDDQGQRSLWLRQVATATEVQLTQPENTFYFSLTMSRDGEYLYYVYGGTTIRNRELFRMPLLGGGPKKLIEDVGSPIGLSPDGKQIAFVRVGDKESSMMVANADGTGQRQITSRPGRRSFGTMFAGGVAWSPDGKKILTVAENREGGGRSHNVVEVSVADGTVNPVTSRSWYEIRRLTSLADGSGLVFTAAERPSDFRSFQIWHLPYPSGEPRKITNDLAHYSSISLNSDSSVLVTVQEDEAGKIWTAIDGDSSRATQISTVSGKVDGWGGVAWTHNGRIVYNSMTGGNEGIWIMDADGGNRKRLTDPDTVAYSPSVSTDGRFIVFTVEKDRIPGVWRMDVDGGNQKQVAVTAGQYSQASSEWVIFGGGKVQKVPIDGGEPAIVADQPGTSRCALSPDGELLACQFDRPGEKASINVLSVRTGQSVKVFDVRLNLPGRIRWSPDGRAITYVGYEDGLSDIWSQPFDGGDPKRLTTFRADKIFSFDWSRDNKLVISHGTAASDVVLIRHTTKPE